MALHHFIPLSPTHSFTNLAPVIINITIMIVLVICEATKLLDNVSKRTLVINVNRRKII